MSSFSYPFSYPYICILTVLGAVTTSSLWSGDPLLLYLPLPGIAWVRGGGRNEWGLQLHIELYLRPYVFYMKTGHRALSSLFLLGKVILKTIKSCSLGCVIHLYLQVVNTNLLATTGSPAGNTDNANNRNF